jgi:HAD superfamily hydrolase (TIGR01509 family)
MSGTKRALVFDFDGLILDTEGAKARAWQEIFRQEGVEMDFDLLRTYVGVLGVFGKKAQEHLEELLGRAVDWEPIIARFRRRHLELIAESPLLPGVAGLMATGRERGYLVGLASSSPRDWVGPWLDKHGLMKFFHSVMTGDRISNLKPHPEVYLRCLEELDALAGVSWAFEDSLVGATAAKQAGLNVAVVPNSVTQHQDFSAMDQVLESLDQFVLP